MFTHHFAPQPSRQAVWSQTATASSPRAICSFDSSFCGAVPAAGETTGLRAHCSLGSTPYPGAAQRDDAYPLSLALCHQDIPTQGLAAVAALKLGCAWQKFVPHCSDMHWKLPTETLGEQLCFQCDAVPNKAALALCVQAAAKWLEITPQH